MQAQSFYSNVYFLNGDSCFNQNESTGKEIQLSAIAELADARKCASLNAVLRGTVSCAPHRPGADCMCANSGAAKKAAERRQSKNQQASASVSYYSSNCKGGENHRNNFFLLSAAM